MRHSACSHSSSSQWCGGGTLVVVGSRASLPHSPQCQVHIAGSPLDVCYCCPSVVASYCCFLLLLFWGKTREWLGIACDVRLQVGWLGECHPANLLPSVASQRSCQYIHICPTGHMQTNLPGTWWHRQVYLCVSVGALAVGGPASLV